MKQPGLKQINDLTDDMLIIQQRLAHTVLVFPESTANVCTMTAHASANVWGAWVEVADDQATPDTLSSKFAANNGQITAFLAEDANQASTRYMVELGYGDAKTIITRFRIISTNYSLVLTQEPIVHAALISAGETIYARAMCATAGSKTLTVSFRYYLL